MGVIYYKGVAYGKGSGGGGGATSLSELSDVNLTSPSDGDFLVYSGDNHKWENQSADNVVTNYDNATHKPTMNDTTIEGDLHTHDLGLVDENDVLTQDQLAALLALIN